MSELLRAIQRQKVFYAPRLSRMELLRLKEQKKEGVIGTSSRALQVHIVRNHAFEPVASVLPPFLEEAGLSVRCSYSEYNDALCTPDSLNDVDLLIFWVDGAKYHNDVSLRALFLKRIEAIRRETVCEILLLPLRVKESLGALETMPSVSVFKIEEFLYSIMQEETIFDVRAEAISGTQLSNQACLMFARFLGGSVLPMLFSISIKAIVTDLDNTLYAGILGEDGIDAVIVTEGHHRLHRELLAFKKNGGLLALSSKNEMRDVKEFFDKRQDITLRWSDFSEHKISWREKNLGLSEIASTFRIGEDAILFLDDNIGELIQAKQSFPALRMVHADDNADISCNAIRYFPGVMKRRGGNKEGALRSTDIKFNIMRKVLVDTPDFEYFQDLQIEITYALNDSSQIARISELARKTNQFIFSYKRYSEAEVASWMAGENTCVLTATLTDRLSESGLIFAAFFRDTGEEIHVTELFMSCRALGRRIEDILIINGLRDACQRGFQKKEGRILIDYTVGERNQPALKWLTKIMGKEIRDKRGQYPIPPDLTFDFPENISIIKQ